MGIEPSCQSVYYVATVCIWSGTSICWRLRRCSDDARRDVPTPTSTILWEQFLRISRIAYESNGIFLVSISESGLMSIAIGTTFNLWPSHSTTASGCEITQRGRRVNVEVVEDCVLSAVLISFCSTICCKRPGLDMAEVRLWCNCSRVSRWLRDFDGPSYVADTLKARL